MSRGVSREDGPISGHPWETLVPHFTLRMVPRGPEAAWSHPTVGAW